MIRKARASSARTLVKQGERLLKAGKAAEALDAFEKALGRDPRDLRARYLAGVVALQAGDAVRAAPHLLKAAEREPDRAEWHYQAGVALTGAGRLGEAEARLRHALKLQPGHAAAWNSLGNMLAADDRPEDAAKAYQKAVGIDPGRLVSYSNLAAMLTKIARFERAEAILGQVVGRAPDYLEAWYNLALTRIRTRDFVGQCQAWRQVLRLDPDHREAVCSLAYANRELADWEGLDELDARTRQLIANRLENEERALEAPFQHAVREDDPAVNLALAKIVAVTRIKDRLDLSPRKDTDPERRLRIGYLSGQFRQHAVLHCLRAFLPAHDRTRFEIFGYGYGRKDDSSYRAAVLASLDGFVDLEELNDSEAAARIHADGIDILVDLTGHTEDSRMGILASRPAPVQVSYLGYMGSSGSEFIDYFISDAVTTPEDLDPFYTETIIRLPDVFMAAPPEPAELARDRAAAGLPEDAMVFASFNVVRKISPKLFALWMRVLERVPGSILWMFALPEARDNLRQAAAASGLAPERLVFAPVLPWLEHKSRLALADLAFDTLPYSGGVTTADILWAEVPVITAPGRQAVSRMTASCLTAVGLDELIVPDLATYETLAVELGRDPPRLAALSARLHACKHSSPLFDGSRFCRTLEAAYERMWKAGTAPEPD